MNETENNKTTESVENKTVEAESTTVVENTAGKIPEQGLCVRAEVFSSVRYAENGGVP